MTVATCENAECYVPPERHDSCAAGGITPCYGMLGHQHVPKRSQGGKRAVVMLCQAHHDCIDNGTKYEGKRLMNDVKDGVYRIWERGEGVALVRMPLREIPAPSEEYLEWATERFDMTGPPPPAGLSVGTSGSSPVAGKCRCERDSTGLRVDVVCPVHDGVFEIPVPSEGGDDRTDSALSASRPSPVAGVIGSPVAESEGGDGLDSPPPSLDDGVKGERDGAQASMGVHTGRGDQPSVQQGGSVGLSLRGIPDNDASARWGGGSPGSPTDLASWKTQGLKLRDVVNSTPWWFGDWLVYGTEHFGADVTWGYAEELGPPNMGPKEKGNLYLRLGQYQSVATVIPPGHEARTRLSWSACRDIALNRQLSDGDKAQVALRAAREGWSREQVLESLPARTAVSKPPRYTAADLRERAQAFSCPENRNHGKRYLSAFLESL
jgi:hypothetical protein